VSKVRHDGLIVYQLHWSDRPNGHITLYERNDQVYSVFIRKKKSLKISKNSAVTLNRRALVFWLFFFYYCLINLAFK